MRLLTEKASSLLRRTGLQNSAVEISTADPSIRSEISAADQVHSILQTVPSVEPALDCIAHLLSPHVVATVLDETPSPLSAFRFFAWASNRRHLRSWSSHNRIISLLRADPVTAVSVLVDLRRLNLPIPPPAFSVLISAFAASGLPERAIESFAMMQDFGCRPNTFTYNTVLNIMIDRNVMLLAMAVYNQMIKSDCRPNRATYALLMDGLCKAGKMDEAFNLFTEMIHRGILPNATVYTVLLSSLCKLGEVKRAVRMLYSMKEEKCMPDSVVYNVILHGFCKLGRINEALQQLRVFREEGFEIGLHGYNCLIDGFFRARRFEEARRCYEEMLENDVVPDCVSYTTMIRGYSEAGRIDDAFSTLSEMTERGIVPDTFCYNTLIKGLCDAGLLDRARTLKLEISQNNCFPDSATYTIMICGLCKEGLVNEAQMIFDEMGKLGCYPTIMTFNALINGLCKAGNLKGAQILFHRMEMGKNPSLYLSLSQGSYQVRDSNSLRKLVEELCESGLVVKAYKLLRDIVESGVMPDVVTYNILIDGFCKVQNFESALKLFKELQLKGHSPDAVTYGTLIDGLLRDNRDGDASKVLQSMLRTGCKPSLSIHNSFMRSLCRKKKVSQAVILWLDHISQESLPEEVEDIKVARKYFEEGYVDEAIRSLIKMDRKRGYADSSPYSIWLIGYCQADKGDEALKIFSIMAEFNIEATPSSCAVLIKFLCQEGKIYSALDVMHYALRKGFQFDLPVGNRLLNKLYTNSKKDALELANRMHLAGYDMDVYLRASTKALLYNHLAVDI